MYEEYLSHHGILGQKWGKQSGPPYPLDQKSHQRVVSNAGSAERFAAIERGGGRAASLHTSNSPNKGGRFINSKMDISAMKIRSKADLKTAKKYIATYVLGKNEVDTYLKANTPFSRIQTSKEMEEFPFYATYKKHDVQMYEGLFGKNLKSRALAAAKASGDAEEIQKAKDMEVYRVQLKNTHNLKIPSDESAGNITAKLLNKGDFKENLKASIDDSKSKMRRPSQKLLFNKAEKAMEKHPEPGLNPSDKKNLYKALNLTLTNHNEQEVAMQKTFYSEMKKKGYHALVDTNDQEYSSYHAKRPMIVFDVDKTKVDKIHTLDDKRVDKLYKRYNTERLLKDSIEQTFGIPMKMLKHSEGGNYMYYAIEEENEDLQHHGILGQKWGIRRFQNKDGTLTPAGRKRVRENADDDQNDSQGQRSRFNIDKKKLVKGLVIGAAAVGASALAYKFATSDTFRAAAKTKLKDLGNGVEKRAIKIGDAMIDAFALSVGGVAVAEIMDRYKDDENATKQEKYRNQIIRDTLSEGVRKGVEGGITGKAGSLNGGNNNSNSNSKGKTVGAEQTEAWKAKVGEPAKKGESKSSPEYTKLFDDPNGNHRPQEQKDTIRNMFAAGFSIEQIDKYLNHSGFSIIDKYLGLEIRW